MKKVAQVCIFYLFLRFYNAFETLLVMFWENLSDIYKRKISTLSIFKYVLSRNPLVTPTVLNSNGTLFLGKSMFNQFLNRASFDFDFLFHPLRRHTDEI